MSIKRRYLLVIALLSASSARADVYSRSYLTIRPRFELNFPERLVMFRGRMDECEDGRGAAFQAVGFFGRTEAPSEIAKYFLPNGKDYITVGEDASQSAVNRTRDVNAFHLGVLTDDVFNSATYDTVRTAGYTNLTFESKVTFCPRQSVSGLGFGFQYRLPKRFWFDVSTSVQSIKNRLGVKEYILNKGGGESGDVDVPAGYYGNALCALGDCNGDRKYGRIVDRSMKKTRVPFVEMRIGRDMSESDSQPFGGFFGVYIPTGNKPTAYYMFEPVVGNNGHWAAMLGGYGKTELARDDRDRTFSTYYHALTRYFAPNHQRRTFDLAGKPWSRYMKVWTNDNDGAALGIADIQSNIDYLINYSTLCVEVKPLYSYDFNIAFAYKDRGFHAEAGYNFYARKAEEINFDHPMNGEVGLMALAQQLNDASNIPYTYQGCTIENEILKPNVATYVDEVINSSGANSNFTYLPITVKDLDPNSGASPACISQTIYATLGYDWKNVEFPRFINGGISYEFTNDNTSVRRWTAWLKVGISI